MRLSARTQRPQKVTVSQGVPLPPPTGGWDAISPLANMPVDRAVQLDNWVCRPGWIEPRRGYVVQCTGLLNTKTPVQSLMAYNGFLGQRELFGVAGGNIYDVTTKGAAVPTTVTGLSNSRLQHVMMSNASGSQFLITVNGADPPNLYDGTVWTQPAYTGSGIDATQFVHVNNYQQRLWFVQVNSTDPVYLSTVGGVSGAAAVFPLGQLLRKGGYLMAIGCWTVDTRQTVDEYIAFISSRGEVVVYAGTDPSTANTWSLVGIYQIGAPIGRRCFLRIAGDLQVITVDGVVGMSEMLSTDRGAANRVSLTSILMNAMATSAQSYKNNFGWQLIEYPLGTLAILNIPQQTNRTQVQYVMNTITGAWSQFVGINANCWEVDAADNVFFGANNGTVYRWNVGAGDDGQPITCIAKGAYNSFGNAAQLKHYKLLQPLITTTGNPIPSVGINVDFIDSTVLSTEEPVVGNVPLWGSVTWGNFNWANLLTVTNNWTGVFGLGHYVSVVTQVVTAPNVQNPEEPVIVQLNGWNILAENGQFV